MCLISKSQNVLIFFPPAQKIKRELHAPQSGLNLRYLNKTPNAQEYPKFEPLQSAPPSQCVNEIKLFFLFLFK